MKNNKKITIAILSLTIFFSVIIASVFSLFKSSVYDEDSTPVFPPLILIDDSYYMQSGHGFDQLPEGSSYLGEIRSSVPSTVLPTESFQANDNIIGAPIYKKGETLLVFIKDSWWEYLVLSEND